MSPIKETHFFVQPGDGLPTIKDRVPTLWDYQRLFESPRPTRGEASTSYSHFPARGGVPGRIKQLVPDAKIVYLVRDPLQRLISHYLHQVAYEGETRPLDRAVGAVDDPMNIYICASCYGLQLEQYLTHFSRDQLLVLDQAALLNARVPTLAQVHRFLEVNAAFSTPNYQKRLNVTSDRRVYPLVYARFRGKAPLKALPPTLRRRIRTVAERAERRLFPRLPAPVLSDALAKRLRAIFSDDIEKLTDLTGIRLGAWDR